MKAPAPRGAQHTSAYVSQHTSAYVTAYVSIRQHIYMNAPAPQGARVDEPHPLEV
jgi:hypothetical protein